MLSANMSLQTCTFAVLFLLYLSTATNGEKISDYRLCADRSCETIISKARTLAKHKSNDPAFLSFERGHQINVYSKSAGNRQDLWGGELNGKRGYFPRSFVRENKVEIPNPQHIVETEHHIPVEERVLGKHVPVRKQEDKLAQHRQAAQQEDKAAQQEEKAPPAQQEQNVDKPTPIETVEASGDKPEDKQKQAEATNTNTQDATVEQTGQDKQEPAVEENKEEVDETEIGDETEVSEEEAEEEEALEAGTDTPTTDTDKVQTDEKEKPEVEEVDKGEDDGTEIKEDETEIGEDETELEDAEEEGADKQEEKEKLKVDESSETPESDIDETELEEEAEEEETEDEAQLEDAAPAKIELEKGASNDETEEAIKDAAESTEEATGDETDIKETDDTEVVEQEGGSMFNSIWSADEEDGANSKNDDDEVSNSESKHLPLDKTSETNNEDHTGIKANHIDGHLHLKLILKSSYDHEHENIDKHEVQHNENIDKQGKDLDAESGELDKQSNEWVKIDTDSDQVNLNDELNEDRSNSLDLEAGNVEPNKEKLADTKHQGEIVDEENIDEKDTEDTRDRNGNVEFGKETELTDNETVSEGGATDKDMVDKSVTVGDNKSIDETFEDKMGASEKESDDKELLKADNIKVTDQENDDDRRLIGDVGVTNEGAIDSNEEQSNEKQDSDVQSEDMESDSIVSNENQLGRKTSKSAKDMSEEVERDTDDTIEKRATETDGLEFIPYGDISRNESNVFNITSEENAVAELESEVNKTDIGLNHTSPDQKLDGSHVYDTDDTKKKTVGPDEESNNIDSQIKELLGSNDESDTMSDGDEESVKLNNKNIELKTLVPENKLDDIDKQIKELLSSNEEPDSISDGNEESVESNNEVEIGKLNEDFDEVLTDTGAVTSSFSGEKEKENVPEQTDEVKAKQDEADVKEAGTETVRDDGEEKSESEQVNKGTDNVVIDSVTVDIPEGGNQNVVDEKNKEMEDKMLEQFENIMGNMANDNTGQERAQGSDNDDLKFINDQGEAVENQANVATDKDKTENVQEMEQPSDNSDNPEIQASIEEEHIDEAMLSNFDKLASGISSLASQTVSESVEDISPSSTVNFVDTPNTNINDVKEVADDNIKDTATLTDSLYETTDQTKASEVSATMGDHSETVQDKVVEESSTELPASDEKAGNGAFVVDGTTFDADFFDEGTTTQEATPALNPTSVAMDTSVYSTTNTVEPTKVNVVTTLPTETVASLDQLQNHQNDPNTGRPDINVQELTEEKLQTASTDYVQVPDYSEVQPTASIEDVSVDMNQATAESVQILGSSFSYVTETNMDSLPVEDTKPMDDVKVTMDTKMLENNETVASDNVQEQIQPSMDPNAYMTDQFLSRKPLSNEPTSVNEPATVDVNADIQDVTGDVDVEDVTADFDKVITDENNNVDNTMVSPDTGRVEPVVEATTPGLEATTPGLADPYGSDDHVFSRKVPDAELDEEVKLSGVGLMKMMEPYLKSMIHVLPPSMQTVLEQEPLGLSPTMTMFVTMLSTNVMALVLIVGCMCKGKKKPAGKKDPLVVIRGLEEELFMATKEKENLEDDLQVKTKKIQELEQDVASQQNSTGSVETDLKTIKLHNDSLKQQLHEQKQELDELKEEAVENNQLISTKDSLIQQYHAEMENLSQRAQDAELALQKTSHGLTDRDEELRVSLEQVQSLSEQIQHLETRKQQLQDEAVDWSEKVKELTEQVEQFTSDSRRMQEDLAFKENELEVLRDCFLQVKAFQGEEEMKEETEQSPDLSEKLKQMMDVSRVNASLRAVEEEKDVVQNKLVIEVESRKELEDQVQLLKRRTETNQTDKMKAERQCQEAQTKLEVLSKYFKEKEAELTRQLGEQEVLKNQNISKLQSSDSITQELAKENDVYRVQIDDLKTEISKAERDFRSQIAANEKKAHENWIATRAAERELKESRHECGMLRQKLTDLERKLMQGPPPGLIRPITHRAMPPPGMLNGPPPPPPPDRPGSRGSVHGHVTPRLRDDDYRASPVGPDRMPPPDRRHPPGPMGPRPPPPHDAMSPPPFAIRPPFPPDRRSPPSFDRYPPARGSRPPFPRPPPPHLRSPPPSEHDDSMQGQYSRLPPPQGRDRGTTRHQSQV